MLRNVTKIFRKTIGLRENKDQSLFFLTLLHVNSVFVNFSVPKMILFNFSSTSDSIVHPCGKLWVNCGKLWVNCGKSGECMGEN
jgi:hypothetical protein